MARISWILFGWFAFFPSVHAASFDCNRASTSVEKLVCSDPALDALDIKLNHIYHSVLDQSPASSHSALVEAQKYWQHRRNECNTKDCVSNMYAVRISDLENGSGMMSIYGPIYKYIIKENNSQDVCEHMLTVFNDKFAHLWDVPYPPVTSDGPHSVDEKYPFPLLPGVALSKQDIVGMQFAAQPTSSEFSGIHWEVGMAHPGGCPPGKSCPGDQTGPVLVGHFDFDNDGGIDTVIQQQFFTNYRLKYQSMEYLIVWRSQKFTPEGVANIWDLAHPKDQGLAPIFLWGTYLRPFTYAGKTYVAEYVYVPAGDADDWTTPPESQDMLVRQYSFTGQKEKFTGRSAWTVRTVCDFEMQPSDDRQ